MRRRRKLERLWYTSRTQKPPVEDKHLKEFTSTLHEKSASDSCLEDFVLLALKSTNPELQRLAGELHGSSA